MPGYKPSDSGLFELHWVMGCQQRSVVNPEPFGLLSVLNKMNHSSFVYDESFIVSYALVIIMKIEKPVDFSSSNLQTLHWTIILFCHCQ